MRLVYTATQKPVQAGDIVVVAGRQLEVGHFAKPHKPDSSGKVSLRLPGADMDSFEYFVGIIGAEWIEREDRANLPPVRIARRARTAADIEADIRVLSEQLQAAKNMGSLDRADRIQLDLDALRDELNGL